MIYNEQVTIDKSNTAGPLDGSEGGLKVTRDTSKLFGGITGYVNAAATIYSVTGKELKTFEWNLLTKTDNYSDSGENCGLYSQINKFAKGPSWAACFEATSTVYNDPTRLVGAEVDCFVAGQDSGLRFGVDIVVGDANQVRNKVRSDVAVASYGMRISASAESPWAKWNVGALLTDFSSAGILLNSNAIRGIHMVGNYIVALDLSGVTGQTSIRLKEGQKITFDEYDQIAIRKQGSRLSIINNEYPIFEIDVYTGDIYKRGIKVL